MRVQQSAGSFALCVENGGLEDLEVRKLYQVLPDREAAREGYIRVVDESGEDYIYPSDLFVPVALPITIARRLRQTLGPKTAPGVVPFLELDRFRAEGMHLPP